MQLQRENKEKMISHREHRVHREKERKAECSFSVFSVRSVRKVSAFTLVELMVVLFVIAVLIMLLLPYLNNVRLRARSTVCQNNLRQFGIAMGKYMSDGKGYFIYPGDDASGSALETHDINFGGMAGYKEGAESGAGGVATSTGESWADFIVDYIPEKITLETLDSGKNFVRVCPEVLRELKNDGNYFDPQSSNFKGYRAELDQTFGEMRDYADFEELEGSGYDTNKNFILEDYFTTYAINRTVYQQDRKNIANSTIAFIDWNARDGWRAYIAYTNWMFTSTNRNPNVTQDTPKWTNAWWVTEVGFHHKDGTNYYANYVAMDGRVSSVTSNQITLDYFKATGP